MYIHVHCSIIEVTIACVCAHLPTKEEVFLEIFVTEVVLTKKEQRGEREGEREGGGGGGGGERERERGEIIVHPIVT